MKVKFRDPRKFTISKNFCTNKQFFQLRKSETMNFKVSINISLEKWSLVVAVEGIALFPYIAGTPIVVTMQD